MKTITSVPIAASLYDSLLALRGWKREMVNGIEYGLNSIFIEKWEGKMYKDNEKSFSNGAGTLFFNKYIIFNRDFIYLEKSYFPTFIVFS